MDVSRFKEKIEGLTSLKEYRVFRAPGRVNIIGEHTDYNDGFVLPAAIEKELLFAISPNDTRELTITSVDQKSVSTFSIDNIEHCTKNKWSNYIRGVCDCMVKAGHDIGGAVIAFESNVPIGSGLSSSAALCVASALAFSTVNGHNLPLEEIAKIAQRAENDFVGTNCGIMDQFISAMGKNDNALLIDCRSLEYELMSFRGDVAIVIGDTTVRRGLVTSQYNTRRSSCEGAVALLKEKLPHIAALRDVSSNELEEYKGLLDNEMYIRAKHVVSENERVIAATKAAVKGDFYALGALLNESHISLRDDYEVSCFELDTLVEIAQNEEGVYGSRMTGAGFGGCTVSLVKPEYADVFIKNVATKYEAATGKVANIFSTTPSDGASEIEVL